MGQYRAVNAIRSNAALWLFCAAVASLVIAHRSPIYRRLCAGATVVVRRDPQYRFMSFIGRVEAAASGGIDQPCASRES